MTLAQRVSLPSPRSAEHGSPITVCADHRTTIVWVILTIAAVKQVVLALIYPPFQGHDEVAHLGNIHVLDRFGRLPTLGDNLPLSWAEYSRFTLDWPALYTANHPPLYYLLSWPFYRLVGDDVLAQLYAVRLFAIPWFLATVWFSYLLTRLLAPEDDFFVLTVPAVVAFQPQLGFEGAIVNNDILSIAIGSALLYLSALALRDGLTSDLTLLLGVTLGLGLLTKATLTIFVPVVGAVALWLAWPRPWSDVRAGRWWRFALGRAACLIVPTVLIPLPWYVFLARTYGDPTAFSALDDLQSIWGPPADSIGDQLLSLSAQRERLHEVWGYFGWKLLPLSQLELWLVEAATLVCVIGVAVGALRFLRTWTRAGRLPVESWRVAVVVMLAGSAILLYGAMLYFGTRIFITQARYIFPVMPALVLLAMLGVRTLIPERMRQHGAAIIVFTVIAFQMLLLSRLVIPYALFG